MRTSRWLWACAVIGAAACGCTRGMGAPSARPTQRNTPPASTQPTPVNVFAPDSPNSAARAEPMPIQVQVRFDILRAMVPQGQISESGKIWNHVNEEAIPTAVAAHLRRNGIRVGVGTTAAWEPIRALFESIPDTRFTPPQPLLVRGGTPIWLEIDRTPRDQSLFIYEPDGRLVGATFAQSTDVLRIEYEVPPTEIDNVSLRIMPEIRQENIEVPAEMTPENLQPRPMDLVRVVRELAFEVRLAPDQFVLVGPGPNVKQTSLLGHAFLTTPIDGQLYESVYFITPQVQRLARAARTP